MESADSEGRLHFPRHQLVLGPCHQGGLLENNVPLCDKMTRDCFESILWSMHLSSPKEDEEIDKKKGTAAYDRLFKIKPLNTHLVAACKAIFQPYQDICIDERMVTSKAHISMKQYMKNKPTKLGFKLFVLDDSSTAYTWNLFVYSGKSESATGNSLSQTDHGSAAIPSGKGYTLFVDNVYTSPVLFKDLAARNFGCCGTIRRNQSGFSKSELNTLDNRATKGDLCWMRNDGLVFVKWMDTQEVNLCSSVHKVFSGKTLKRKVAGRWCVADKGRSCPRCCSSL